MEKIIEFILPLILVINALAFVPQIWEIYKKKAGESISPVTLVSFIFIYILLILYGTLQQNYKIILSFSLSIFAITCVLALTMYYRRVTKKALNFSEKEQLYLLESIIGRMPGHVYWVDKNNFYMGCNDNQATSLGLLSRQEIIGKTNNNLQSVSISETLDKINKQVITTQKAINSEEPYLFPDGQIGTFLSSKTPLYNQDKHLIGMLGISIDITKQKAAEARERLALEQAAAAEARAQAEAELRQAVMVLAGSIAHDMRTPLATIRLLSDMTGKITTPLLHAYEITKTAELSNVPEISARYLQKMATIPSELHTIVTEMNDYINVSLKAY